MQDPESNAEKEKLLLRGKELRDQMKLLMVIYFVFIYAQKLSFS